MRPATGSGWLEVRVGGIQHDVGLLIRQPEAQPKVVRRGCSSWPDREFRISPEDERGGGWCGPAASFLVFFNGGSHRCLEPAALAAASHQGNEHGNGGNRREGQEHPHSGDHSEAHPDDQRQRRGEQQNAPGAAVGPVRDPQGLRDAGSGSFPLGDLSCRGRAKEDGQR
jgi:hypothetical protein